MSLHSNHKFVQRSFAPCDNFASGLPDSGSPTFGAPARGITSDLAAVFCSVVEWLVVSLRGLG